MVNPKQIKIKFWFKISVFKLKKWDTNLSKRKKKKKRDIYHLVTIQQYHLSFRQKKKNRKNIKCINVALPTSKAFIF
jgi:hypothetical protein